MIDVRRDDHPAPRHFVAHQVGRKLFPLRDVLHFLRDDSFTGKVHLGNVAVAGARHLRAALG